LPRINPPVSIPKENMALDIGKITGTIENELIRFIPLIGNYLADMTPEQKQAFLLLLAEAISRGAAQGIMQGSKGNNQ